MRRGEDVMRISSRTFLESPVVDMTALQANVDRTQREVATGIRADAALPGNALRLDALDAANTRLERYAANTAGIRDRLNGGHFYCMWLARLYMRNRAMRTMTHTKNTSQKKRRWYGGSFVGPTGSKGDSYLNSVARSDVCRKSPNPGGS